ncbi:HEPN domain-containing protein [Mesorhizobium jarvisii]|uniref:HEPN domain-containing protein n=1 Tax=Mesorhizobium jarvisii TaxID=1777867 RepID=UPI001F0A92E1|nr:HEPN domain-containing protein [Mesorhizobium jarvisii]MCH4560979.1 HEPN domain-containing protein [Mesorhizobium jarvisii]
MPDFAISRIFSDLLITASYSFDPTEDNAGIWRMRKPFTPKEKRILLSCAENIFKPKSLIVPKSFAEIPRDRTLMREIRLENRKYIYLTDFGLNNFRKLVELLVDHDYFDGKVEYSDVWSAWRGVIQDCFSTKVMPDSADEVLGAISGIVSEKIREYSFIVPIFGVSLEKVDTFKLGSMVVIKSPASVLDSAQIAYDKHPDPLMLQARPGTLWLHGVATGTEKVARRLFAEEASLVAGTIAIAAAAKYENGAAGFRIGTGMTREDAPGDAVWMSWGNADSHVTTHFPSARGQRFAVDTEMADGSDTMRMIELAASNLQKSHKTEVEEAIERAIYWFSDAHRDSPLVMRIVKYWSCVEAFFSLDKKDVTRSVSSGLASILIYGGFRFVHYSEYATLKKKISDLYNLRSLAVHRADHKHISEKDVSQLSQWVAWMIIEILHLSASGYATLDQIKKEVDRLDAISRT